MESANLGSTSPYKLVGNACNITLQNLVPPVFPLASRWNATAYKFLPEKFQEGLARNFEPGGARLRVSDLQTEEAAGLGFGVSWLAVISVVAAAGCYRQRATGRAPRAAVPSWVAWLPYVALLAYMVKVGLTTSGRLITPYYPLLLPVWLQSVGQARIVRATWWKLCAGAVLAIAMMLVLVSPARPLLPIRSWLAIAQRQGLAGPSLQRAAMVYDVYAARGDVLAPVRELLPADVQQVGLISFGDIPEGSLWRPFGTRRIHNLSPDVSAAELSALDVTWIIIGADNGRTSTGESVSDWAEAWAAAHAGRIIGSASVQVLASQEVSQWYIVALPH
jgi:hypothetical protein